MCPHLQFLREKQHKGNSHEKIITKLRGGMIASAKQSVSTLC